MFDAIIITELFADNSQLKARELYLVYQSSSEKTKVGITGAVKKLFELSMYMRGWMGKGDYPVEKAPVDNQVIVDLNVTAAILEFELACSELGEIGCVILDLPLLKYRAEDFHLISSVTNGRTIREKIDIVKAGDEHDNYDSCIRLSSNYLAVSSY